jgi:adenosylhomocysteine nucleosidase
MEACDFGIVFALAAEAGGLLDLLEDVAVTRGHEITVRQGRLHGRSVVLVESGPGRERAARATHALLDAHRPPRVVSAGFAGGLDPALCHGDLVLADTIVDCQGQDAPLLLEEAAPMVPDTFSCRVGRLLAVDRIIRLPSEKRELGVKHQALACDMESLAVAEVCRQRGVPLLAVRAISDTADEELPADIEKLLAQASGPARWGTAIGSILRRPSSLKDLLRLRHRAIEASDRLAKFLAEIIRRSAEQARAEGDRALPDCR